MDWPEASFWDWSLALYGRPAVERACLELQGRHGLDVNLLLLACWLAGRGVALEHDTLDRLQSRVRDWQAEVVRPLRAVRQRLRAPRGEVAEAFADLAQALRRRLLDLEIDAEHLEQLALDRVATPLPAGAAPGVDLAARNLAACAAFDAADRAALEALLAAAFPEASAETLAQALSRVVPGAAGRR